MGETLRDTIKKVTLEHCRKGNPMFGQTLSAVGFVGGTIDPETPNIVELSMADVAGGGIAVGASLFSRPIYVVRYQGFQWFNAPFICNYAAKSKELWGRPCPVFVRSISMEGGIGPVAGSSHHGIYYRQPGVRIVAPMSPAEYEAAYLCFCNEDEPYYISEHRKSWDNSEEFKDIFDEDADISLFPFSITRFEAVKAERILRERGIKCNVFHQWWIKPFAPSHESIECLRDCSYGGIVLDDDYENGIAKNISADLMLLSGRPVRTLCIEEKTAGFAPRLDNLPPTAEKIVDFVCRIVDNKGWL